MDVDAGRGGNGDDGAERWRCEWWPVLASVGRKLQRGAAKSETEECRHAGGPKAALNGGGWGRGESAAQWQRSATKCDLSVECKRELLAARISPVSLLLLLLSAAAGPLPLSLFLLGLLGSVAPSAQIALGCATHLRPPCAATPASSIALGSIATRRCTRSSPPTVYASESDANASCRFFFARCNRTSNARTLLSPRCIRRCTDAGVCAAHSDVSHFRPSIPTSERKTKTAPPTRLGKPSPAQTRQFALTPPHPSQNFNLTS
ncbi:hypothetical protein L1887_52934 [Cichorium endivia]|nr:hypothetical protein L1887_52934 [Cichorium endivia]